MPLPIGPDDTQFITLDELKSHLNIPESDTTDDVELEMHRSAAEEHVQGLIGPVLQREVVETLATKYQAALLSTLPVLSVTGVQYAGNAWTGWTSSLSTGLLSTLPSGDVTVTYLVGRTSCPDAVRLAALIIAGHLWQTQRGPSAPTGALPNDFGATPVGVGYLVPNRALELLGPYLLAPGIA